MRKLATAAAVSLALASSGALGLGLGDIEMQSALNQPMSAEIPLTAVRPGELDGMIVQLASEDAFERAGINLSESLTDLQFSVDQSSGSPVIRIQSSQPVAEPFLNFLLEVDWPQGRVVREYTVLLDPPVFISPGASSRNSAADQPAVVQGGEGALVAPTPIERSPEVEPDGLDVPLVELEDAPSEPVLTLEEATTGGISAPEADQVPAVTVADDQLLSDTATAGQAVSLTDLGETDAAVQQQQADAQVASESSESSDQSNQSTDPNEGAVVVSLDDLGAEQPVETGESVQQVEVLPGDTLFRIASENTPSGASVQQMMMAMLAANESAFINGNINLVRAGTILRIPEFGEATQITQGEALAAIAEQNQLWQDYRDSLRESANTQIAQDITDTDVVEEPAEEPEPIVEEVQEPVEVAEIEDPVETPEVIENETATESVAESSELSEEAREIIEAARRELEGAAELSIVAADTATDSVASATADESADSDASSRIGEINLELQMTQEELSSARLRSEDLSDKASDLESTADNLGAMVALRQNEISQLEAQLVAAREAAEQAAAEQAAAEEAAAEQLAAEEAAAEQAAAEQLAAEESAAEQAAAEQLAAEEAAAEQAAAEQLAAEQATAAEQSVAENAQEAVENAQDTLAQAGESVVAEADELADSAGAAVDEVVDNADSVAQEAAGLVDGAVEGVEDSLAEAGDAVDSSVGALTEAGEALDGDNVSEDISVDGTATATDVVEAGNEETAAITETASNWFQELRESPIRMAIAGVGALSFLGILGTLLLRRKRDDEDDFLEHDVDRHEFDNDFADDYNESAAIASAAAGEEDFSVRDEKGGFATPGIAAATAGVVSADIAAAASADEADSDDETLSEVEVYLAYGLHSQAEEMLLKATASDPDNEVYAGKLLETYHAQGNAALYHENAVDFHQRFGGNDNPQWTAIASMGSALMPNEALYAQGEQTPSSMGSDASLDDAGVFSPGSDDRVSDDIGKVDDMDDTSLEADATSLMDESIDPAFLFDESDLESTGDLSSVVDEIRAEDDDERRDASSADNIDTGFKTPSADGVDTSLFDADSALGNTGSVDTLQDTVDDLTLDLDQLSGDLELDSAELLNGDLGDLELLDMKEGGNDFLSSASTDTGTAVEEDMEGMMDLAKAYLDIGDNDSATSTLDEIVKSGSPAQVSEAEILLRKIS